ncbi:MCE family protein [[Mycobacterium] wendilense]|uniref:MCE family protein n=1 Tax=[Mycobacterium] wendilense TaxID=3064284 RepID=A0ABN9P8E6_9MYCO|nr:MCE family protein [Mycolicibacterium sp. MU0050]CAJ1586832.1 MCE family protein [Mycolicibacterium sp. MU0050]
MLEKLKPQHPGGDHNKTGIGVIALLVICGLVGAVLLVGGLGLGKTRYQAEFVQAAQLRAGDPVKIAGVTVGAVAELHLADDRVVVTFDVDNNVQLGADTGAGIKLTTLLGSRYLELSPGTSGDLAEGRIPLANTTVPYDLQRTLANATTTFEKVDADRIAQSLTTLSQSLDGVPEALPQALTNLRSLSAIVAERRDQLTTLLASTDTLTTMIRDQKASIGALILRGRDLLAELTTRREALQHLFASATALVDTLNKVLGDRPELDVLLTSVGEFADMIASHDAQFRNTLQVLPIPMRNIANLTGSGTAADATLPAGPLVDSWMCAISGRAEQFGLVEYFKDCE